MKIFFAGSETNSANLVLQAKGVQDRLYSFFSIKNTPGWLANAHKMFPCILLDSGGFVARTKGVEIKIEEYGDFIAQNKQYVFAYANLDYKDTNRTLYNQNYLESRGLHPVPVYHVDEWLDKKYDLLDSYLAKYPYVALGGAAKDKGGKSVLHPFLSAMFARSKGKTRFHGFGITDVQYLKKYPFYSVDSTSWNQGGRYGNSLEYENFNIKSKKKDMHLFYRKNCGYKRRDDINIEVYLKMINEVNFLWKIRGINWTDTF